MATSRRCYAKAWSYVHATAAAGSAISTVPVPGLGTAGLATLEVSMIVRIGRIYGENLTASDVKAIAGVLGVGSIALRHAVRELLVIVPIAGWALKAGVAYSTITAIGAAVIQHFEERHPGAFYM